MIFPCRFFVSPTMFSRMINIMSLSPTDFQDTPPSRTTRNSKHAIAGKSMLATLLRLAVTVELHATGQRLTGNPLVRQVAWLMATRELQPLTACVLAYCRLVDRCLIVSSPSPSPTRKPPQTRKPTIKTMSQLADYHATHKRSRRRPSAA